MGRDHRVLLVSITKFPLQWYLGSFGLVTWMCGEQKSGSLQIYPPAKDFWKCYRDCKEKMGSQSGSYTCILNAKVESSCMQLGLRVTALEIWDSFCPVWICREILQLISPPRGVLFSVYSFIFPARSLVLILKSLGQFLGETIKRLDYTSNGKCKEMQLFLYLDSKS